MAMDTETGATPEATPEVDAPQGLDKLAELQSEVVEQAPAEPKIDKLGRSYATGKRKNAIVSGSSAARASSPSTASPGTSISPVRCCR